MTSEREIVEQMRRDPAIRRRVAYHEAGHAAMHFFFGTFGDFYGVDMIGTLRVAGRVQSRAYTQSTMAIEGAREISAAYGRAKAASVVMHNLSGPCAGNKVEAESVADWLTQLADEELDTGDDPSHDLVRAREAAKVVINGERAANSFVERVAGWTQELIDHPPFWSVIDALAIKLLTINRMTGPSAWKIMDRAWGSEHTPLFEKSDFGKRWRRRLCPKLPRPASE